jgi:hypothetical protein
VWSRVLLSLSTVGANHGVHGVPCWLVFSERGVERVSAVRCRDLLSEHEGDVGFGVHGVRGGDVLPQRGGVCVQLGLFNLFPSFPTFLFPTFGFSV